MESTLSYDIWVGRTAYDTDGEKVGEIKDLYYDDVTGRPEWVAVKAGLFKGTRFVPLAGARIEEDEDDGRLILNYSNEMIGAAPDMDTADDHLDADQEQSLYSYYGFEWDRRTDEGHGYGQYWDKQRFGVLHQPIEHAVERHEQRVGEHTEEIPVEATVEVPVSTSVRLRRYQTEKQRTETRQVQVPVTETEEHVEVEDVEGRGTIGNDAGHERLR